MASDRSRIIVVAVIALLVVAAAAYFFLRPQAAAYSDVRALVRAIESEGVSCKDLQVSAPDPTPDIVDFGSCTMDGKTVNLHVYNNDDALQEHIEGNLAAEGKNPNYFTSLVAGSNWVVDTYSDETSRRIQKAIGGEIH